MAAPILIIDDEKNIRRSLRMVLEGAGQQVLEAASAEDGLVLLESEDVDLVILDVRLPGMGGIEALEKIRQLPHNANVPVLMISGHASVAEAVHAIQLGASDFFEKPLDRDRVLVSVMNALRTAQLQREVAQLRRDVGERYEMIGSSDAMARIFAAIEKIAPTKGRVLITGESGTGKELIARAIHRLSPRRDEPFVKVNCAAIPGTLLESELFGYERGAFTGAQSRKKGLFELANNGTLLLDEIGDMSLDAQAKVLRALQSGEITRVGSERTISVDVRVLAATNKDLEGEVRASRFREDLYFRLNVLPLHSPPLRERRGDVPLLARAFIRDFCRENGMREKEVDEGVFMTLSERPWPGNVRELRNVVERMVILSGDRIREADVPLETQLGRDMPVQASIARDPQVLSLPHRADANPRPSLREFREEAERAYILETLEHCEWNISRAAAMLGVERTNLHKKMKAYGIRRELAPAS